MALPWHPCAAWWRSVTKRLSMLSICSFGFRWNCISSLMAPQAGLPTKQDKPVRQMGQQEVDRITLLAVDQPTLTYVLVGHASGELAGSTSKLHYDGCCLLGRIHVRDKDGPCQQVLGPSLERVR